MLRGRKAPQHLSQLLLRSCTRPQVSTSSFLRCVGFLSSTRLLLCDKKHPHDQQQQQQQSAHLGGKHESNSATPNENVVAADFTKAFDLQRNMLVALRADILSKTGVLPEMLGATSAEQQDLLLTLGKHLVGMTGNVVKFFETGAAGRESWMLKEGLECLHAANEVAATLLRDASLLIQVSSSSGTETNEVKSISSHTHCCGCGGAHHHHEHDDHHQDPHTASPPADDSTSTTAGVCTTRDLTGDIVIFALRAKQIEGKFWMICQSLRDGSTVSNLLALDFVATARDRKRTTTSNNNNNTQKKKDPTAESKTADAFKFIVDLASTQLSRLRNLPSKRQEQEEAPLIKALTDWRADAAHLAGEALLHDAPRDAIPFFEIALEKYESAKVYVHGEIARAKDHGIPLAPLALSDPRAITVRRAMHHAVIQSSLAAAQLSCGDHDRAFDTARDGMTLMECLCGEEGLRAGDKAACGAGGPHTLDYYVSLAVVYHRAAVAKMMVKKTDDSNKNNNDNTLLERRQILEELAHLYDIATEYWMKQDRGTLRVRPSLISLQECLIDLSVSFGDEYFARRYAEQLLAYRNASVGPRSPVALYVKARHWIEVAVQCNHNPEKKAEARKLLMEALVNPRCEKNAQLRAKIELALKEC